MPPHGSKATANRPTSHEQPRNALRKLRGLIHIYAEKLDLLQSPKVSTANDVDAVAISKISGEAATEDFVRQYEPKEMLKLISNPNYYVVVGKLDNQVVGYAISIYSWGKLHVLDVAVRKRSRRLGVGKAIVRHLVSHASQKALSEVYCEVKARNILALNLFIAQGLRFRIYSKVIRGGVYGLHLPLRRSGNQ